MRRLMKEHLRPHLGRLLLALLFMAVAAATAGGLAKLMEPIIDQVFQAHDAALLLPVAAAVMATFALRGFATYGHSVQMNHIGQRIIAEIQQRLFDHLIVADLAFFHATASGQLISHFTNDVNAMRVAVAECLTSSIKSTLTLLILVGVMFHQDWVLACLAFGVFPLAALFVARLGRRMRRVSTSTQVEMGVLSTVLNQIFQGARHVKAYGMEAREQERVKGLVENLYRLTHKAFRVAALSTPVTEILSGAAIVTVIVYGGHRVIAGESTTGALFSFITAFLLAYEPLKRLAKLNAQLQAGLAGADRIFALLDLAPQVVDRPTARPLPKEATGILFSGVHFAYEDGHQALRGITLEVPAGRTVALVGASGSGKSTALNLIPRFYDVQQGAVLVGGVDVRDVTLASLRRQLALVSQEAALFNDTIQANIAYGRPDADADAVIAAARAAAAHAFIMALPHGYATRVGEQGIKLSGGQRQRIAIARAMLRNAPILLLDEATSALDTESERAVQEALRTLQHGRTTLVIAHRLSTVVEADRIYVLDQGVVAEEGTHASLLAAGGLYSRLYGNQLAG